MNIKRNISRLAAGVSSGLMVALALPMAAFAAPAPTTVYSAIPSTLPPNVASLGFEATSTSEFGDRVTLAGSNRDLKSVTVTMSDWALFSDYSTNSTYAGNSSTWSHLITVNVYSTHLGVNNAPDQLLATTTQDVTIPWRPAPSADCTGNKWKANDGNCYSGIAFNAKFDFSSNVTLPNEVILGVAYNTADYGYSPLRAAGPYNSLNVGTPENQTATVGSDSNPDAVFWNTSHAPFYSDGGAGGTSIFRQDTNWSPNGTVAFKIDTTPGKDQCKGDGWKSFTNPTFKNQGQCVSSFASAKNLEF